MTISVWEEEVGEEEEDSLSSVTRGEKKFPEKSFHCEEFLQGFVTLTMSVCAVCLLSHQSGKKQTNTLMMG